MIEEYYINRDTLFIKSIDNNKSEIYDLNGKYIINQNIFDLVEENCEYYGSTYEGRIKAAQKILNFSYKLPLLIEESEKIIFFPTKSYTSDDCCWINHNYVKKREKKGNNTKVMFQNGVEKEFNISKLSFENQLLRAGMLDAMITKRISKK